MNKIFEIFKKIALSVLKNIAILIFICFFFIGCGGSGGGGSEDNINTIGQGDESVSYLARTAYAENFFLSKGRIYFTDSNKGNVFSVPKNGGEVICHLNNYYSTWDIIHGNETIYILISVSDGEIISLPEKTEDIFPISERQTNTSTIHDIASDGHYIYWTEYTGDFDKISRILQAPVMITSSTPIKAGKTMEIILEKEQVGRLRIILDDDILFISEGLTGDIYKMDLQTGEYFKLVSELETDLCDHLYGIPLFITNNYLFAILNCDNIIRIDKNTGGKSLIASDTRRKFSSDMNMMYWWKSEYPDILLNKYDCESDIVSTITSIPNIGGSHTEIYDICSDGSYVWWFNDAKFDKVQLQYVSCQGGLPTLIDSYDFKPFWMLCDSENLYWGSYGAIWQLSKTGGTASILTNESSGSSLIVYPKQFVWAGSAGIQKLPKLGITTVKPTQVWVVEESTGCPEEFVIDDKNLYWTAGYYDRNSDSHITKLYSMSLSDNSTEVLAIFLDDAYGRDLFVYEDKIFIAVESWADQITTISVLPKTGGIILDLCQIFGADRTDIFVINNKLYILASGLYSYDLNTGKLSTLIESLNRAQNIYVDECFIYWTEASYFSSSGSVNRIPLNGGRIEKLYIGYSSYDISGDDTYIYWAATWDGILRMKK